MMRGWEPSAVAAEGLGQELLPVPAKPAETLAETSGRVAAIARAIKAGEYRVDATSIAEKLMEKMKR